MDGAIQLVDIAGGNVTRFLVDTLQIVALDYGVDVYSGYVWIEYRFSESDRWQVYLPGDVVEVPGDSRRRRTLLQDNGNLYFRVVMVLDLQTIELVEEEIGHILSLFEQESEYQFNATFSFSSEEVNVEAQEHEMIGQKGSFWQWEVKHWVAVGLLAVVSGLLLGLSRTLLRTRSQGRLRMGERDGSDGIEGSNGAKASSVAQVSDKFVFSLEKYRASTSSERVRKMKGVGIGKLLQGKLQHTHCQLKSLYYAFLLLYYYSL